MFYKSATEIYLEEIRDKGLYIPRLSYLDEVNFNMFNEEISRLANILNMYPPWRQFFMFGIRHDYKSLVKELLAFYAFWAFNQGKEIRIDKVHTKEWN